MAPQWRLSEESAYDEVSFEKKDLESSCQRAILGLLAPNHFRIQLMNVHLKSDRAIETVHFATLLHVLFLIDLFSSNCTLGLSVYLY